MSLVKTKSFELAIYSKGNPTSDKLALVLPGKLDTKDYTHMISHVNLLADLGFLALSFDPPGTWESSGDIELYNVTNYVKAINELISYFGNKPTFVMGHSRGGSMAMLAGITNPTISAFAAIMSYSYKKGFKASNEDDWKKDGFIISTRDLPPGGGPKTKEFKLPFSFLEDQKQYDMEEGLKMCPKPKLFIYGTKDILVPAEKVKEVYEMAGKPKEIYELDSPHDYRLNNFSIEEVNKVIENFLKKYDL